MALVPQVVDVVDVLVIAAGGTAAALGREMSLGDLTRTIVEEAPMHFEKLSGKLSKGSGHDRRCRD